jgi:hypothetical protein
MKNSHLPSHVAWIAYKHQLWPSLRYGLGTMTNAAEEAEKLLNKVDCNTLNVLGIFRNVATGLRKLHITFEGFGLFNLPTEQLISRINMLFQHYHISTNLSRKLDSSLRYLQLQLGTPQNPLMLDFLKWGHLAPLSWVKMLWKSLHDFNIQLYMLYPTIPTLREQDQVIMDIFFSLLHDLDPGSIKSLNRCRGAMKAIFLSDITTADGNYLEHFVFKPGTDTTATRYIFPREKPTRDNWATWIDFWRGYTTTGGKLKTPLGNWIYGTHRVWEWYYNKEDNNLQHVKGGKVIHFKPARGFRLTRSMTTYQRTWDEQHNSQTQLGHPTSVRVILSTRMSKLQEGPSLVDPPNTHTNFWDFICSWGGSWMWEDIDFTQETTQDLQWIAEGMKNNTLVWTTNRSYDRKKAADLSGVGWIIFCKSSGLRMTGTLWEKSPQQVRSGWIC